MAEEEKTTPQHLYHYYKVSEHTEAIFTKDELFFQSPSKYNDVFDSKIFYILEGSQVQIESWLRKQRKQFADNIPKGLTKVMSKSHSMKQIFIDTYNRHWEDGRIDTKEVGIPLGIYCLTERHDNILMWAHYSESLYGFCLQFSTCNNFFDKSSPISYQVQLPKHNIRLGQIDPHKYRIKAKDWEYEKEWRIFQLSGPGIYQYPTESLTGVILGCRMTFENKTKIINWCYQRNPRPQLYNAVPKETEYGLDIVPFDYPA